MIDVGARGPARPFGLPDVHRLWPPVAALLALLLAGCAGARGGGAPGPAEGPEAPEPPGDRRTAEAELERVRSALPADPVLALHRADSLYFALRAAGGSPAAPEALRLQVRAALAAGDTAGAVARLRELVGAFPTTGTAEDAAVQLARLLRTRAEDPAAVGVLLRHGGAGEESLTLMRRAAGAMSSEELEGATASTGPGTPPAARALVLAELGKARALAGQPAAARRAAERALEAGPEEPDRRTARAVLAGEVEPSREPLRMGVLLPESGRFEAVGRWVRRGMRLALEDADLGPAIEVVTRDLSEAPAPRLLRELEEADVSVVLGPLQSEALEAAARARGEPGLLVISPTADDRPAPRHAYTLWNRSRRHLDAAAALGRWVGARLRPGPVGAVYPAGQLGRRALLRFRRAVGEGGGGWFVASAAYDPDATTLEDPVTAVSAFSPEAVYAPASGTSSLLQMAPQLAYYGVRAAVVLGGPEWSRSGAVRRLDPVFTQYRVTSAFGGADEGAEDPREGFRARYEREHRTTLGDNILPMLGHDAALLLRRAAADTRPPRPRALARAFAGLGGVEAATGVLSPEIETGTVRRRIRLRALEDRQLRPTSAEEARAWLDSAGRLEAAGARGRRAGALRAVREAEIPLEGSRSEVPEGGEGSR